MSTDQTFGTFDTWTDLLDYVSGEYTLYYHAPLDVRPAVVQVARRKDGQLRVTPVFTDADPFTADDQHLSRFRRKVL